MTWSGEDLDAALNGPVAAILFDYEGIADIASLLESVPSTDFESDMLEKILDIDEKPKDWEVGEVIAEAYLSQYPDLPYTSKEEEKNPLEIIFPHHIFGFNIFLSKE